MPQKKSLKATSTKKRELVLLDTGPLVGLYNKRDDWHTRCNAFFKQDIGYDYLLTQAVICEVVFHIQKDEHVQAASKAVIHFLGLIDGNKLQVHELESGYVLRIKQLREKYEDKKLDFADLSLVLAAEDRQIDQVVTLDRKDFGFLKFKSGSGRKQEQGFRIILPEPT